MPQKATLVTFTVNHQKWTPGLEVPYIIGAASFDAAPDVQLVAELVGCQLDQVAIGMPLAIRFEPVAEIWIPQLCPALGT
jgi:uncharacterized OB-fold protein